MMGAGASHLTIFARQFASMVASSLQLVTVLDNLARETPNRTLRNAVRDVSHQVSSGADLCDALEHHPRLFNGVFVGLVRSGLESGQLAAALHHVAEYLERVQGVNRRVISASAYPLFVLVAFVATASTMMFFILPQYESIFRSFGRELPGPTRAMLGVAAALRSGERWIEAGVVLLVLIPLGLRLVRGGRVVWDRHKLRVPLLGPVWRLAALARFSRTLAVQVGNQVPVVRALNLAAASAGNAWIEAVARGIAGEIERGASVTAAFRAEPLFAGLVVQMIAAGEEAGRLDELLISAAAYFDSLLAQRIDTMTGLINPLLTAVLGGSIAAMMVAAFLPVFDLPSVMQ